MNNLLSHSHITHGHNLISAIITILVLLLVELCICSLLTFFFFLFEFCVRNSYRYDLDLYFFLFIHILGQNVDLLHYCGPQSNEKEGGKSGEIGKLKGSVG